MQKPRNLLVNSNCDLKICDFGLARALIPDLKVFHDLNYSLKQEFWLTTWQLGGIEHQNYYYLGRIIHQQVHWKLIYKVDVWSVGCILAELLRRKPFLPGCDTKNQIELTFEIIGTPSE